MFNKTTKQPAGRFIYLLYFSIGSIILFLPVLNKNFVSDDYVVLKRVCLEGSLIVDGFFRPLSDLSIYLNYKIFGLAPLGFNIVNILIHAFNSFLLFELLLQWKWTTNPRQQRSYALIAGILFLSYPFHNEAIAWLLGRGASLAGTCMIIALMIFTSSWKNQAKIFGVCACYFIGMFAYESIVVLPLVILILLVLKKNPVKECVLWMAAFLIIIILHLALRYNFSGGVFGHYGENILKNNWLAYPSNLLKALSRLLVPPGKNSFLFLIASAVAALLVSAVFFRVFMKQGKQKPGKLLLIILLSIIGCTLIIPVIVGVSTHTSESDRLLYIPSIFVCCLVSLLLSRWARNETSRRIVLVILCVYHVVFLEINNYNWFKAGNATYSILKSLRSDSTAGNVFVTNLPNEINGAYVFREGFKDALIVNNIDTSKITVTNKLSKELTDETIWKPVYSGEKIFIPPFVAVDNGLIRDSFKNNTQIITVNLPKNGHLYYWNQKEWLLVKND